MIRLTKEEFDDLFMKLEIVKKSFREINFIRKPYLNPTLVNRQKTAKAFEKMDLKELGKLAP